jgi:20S proteasome alpha/beta subunit
MKKSKNLVYKVSASLLSLIVLGCYCSPQVAGPQKRQEIAAPNSVPNFLHGTIVVVVSTKDGFVLAGDSRASRGCEAVPGEFEKVFSLGNRSGIVIAGMIVSHDPSEEVSEAVATQLHFLDENSLQGSEPQATTVMWQFVEAVKREAMLLDPDVALSSPVAAATAVSINEKGVSEWITLTLAPIMRTARGGTRHFDVTLQSYMAESPASKVQSLGSGSTVTEQLLSLGQSNPANSYSQEPIMEKYYSLKASNKLSELSLEDGEKLAIVLVEAAINYAAAHPCLGIGGSVDVLSLTDGGTKWVHKKMSIAPIPPVYRARILDSQMFGRIDGGEWVRGTVPVNATVIFNGDLETRVVQPKFEGPCNFEIGQNADQRMPGTTARLKATFGKACDVYVQSPSGRVRVSSPPPQPVPSRPGYEHDYECMSNSQLKRTALTFSKDLKTSLESFDAYEQQQRYDERAALGQLPIREQSNVLGLKYDLLRIDASSQWVSNYDSEIVPRAVALQYELIKRLHASNERHQSAAEHGWTPSEIYAVTEDLEGLASRVPESGNTGSCQ